MVNPHEKSSPSKELEAMTLEAAELEKQLEAAEASEMASLQERKLGSAIGILVGGLEHCFYFPIYWEFYNPNWLSYFSEG